MIPDDQVEEVRARADIVDVIGEYVQLKKAGREYKANCPFHEERTPSFYVVPAKAMYHCFGCGESGDIFAFVMKRMGLDFVDAVKHVAQRTGVEVREVKKGQKSEDPFRAHFEANAFARGFFQKALWEMDEGKGARAYLEERGVSREIAERFGLGYALDEWRALREAAAQHGMTDELLLEVGLLATSEKRPEPYDRVRDRLIFPIESMAGKVVAFGGRVLDAGGKPKYLNSPETPIYHKGRLLYGLASAKNAIRREDAALVVEGYMDLVAIASAGLENVVATLGTAMTEEHARLLGRYTKRTILLFDSDAAGLKATFRAGDTLLAEGGHPAVVTLPPGEDPDTVVQKEGAEGLRTYVDQAVDVLDRKIQILEGRDYFSSIERTRDAVDRLLPTLRAAKDPALRDIYVAKVSERTGVRRETLDAEIAKTPRSVPKAAIMARPPRVPRTVRPRMGPERDLLVVLLKDHERHWVDRALEQLGEEDFEDPLHQTIFRAIIDDPDLIQHSEGMPPPVLERLEELLGDARDLTHGGEIFESAVARLRTRRLQARIEELKSAMNAETDPERLAQLVRELDRLADERRQINQSDWQAAAQTAMRAGGNPNTE